MRVRLRRLKRPIVKRMCECLSPVLLDSDPKLTHVALNSLIKDRAFWVLLESTWEQRKKLKAMGVDSGY